MAGWKGEEKKVFGFPKWLMRGRTLVALHFIIVIAIFQLLAPPPADYIAVPIVCGFEPNEECHFDRDDGDRNTERAKFGEYSYHITGVGKVIQKNVGFGCKPDLNYSTWFNDVTGNTEANVITIKSGNKDVCTVETADSKFRSYHQAYSPGYLDSPSDYLPDTWYWVHINYTDGDVGCRYTVYNSDGSVFWTWIDFKAQTAGTIDRFYSGSHNANGFSTYWDNYPYGLSQPCETEEAV